MAGRKRKIGAREPNGKLQRAARSERREDLRAVGLEARARIFGVAEKTAADMPETSWLGVLRAEGRRCDDELAKSALRGEYRGITTSQYEAAKQYAGIVEDRRRMLQVPGFPEAANLDRQGGRGGDEVTPGYADWCARVQRRLNLCEQALDRLNDHERSVTKAVVLNGYQMPHRLDELRAGLNALAKALGT